MGRRAKQSDPLGPRASRVEKARAPRTGLPDWYYRVLSLRWDREPFKPTNTCDFDEDLSELEEGSEEEDDAEQLGDEEEDCECDSEDSECGCQFQDDYDSESDESERSYDGSEADYYYELKREREERKREIKKEERWERLDKQQRFEFEKSKEEEVRAAERSLAKLQKEGRTLPLKPASLTGHQFPLFCSDHVNHFYYSGLYTAKYVQFFDPDDKAVGNGSHDPDEKSGDDAGMLYGELVLDMDTSYKFGPFFPPSNATYRPVKVETRDGKHRLSLDFIGNGYLKLKVSRNMVFMYWDDESPAMCPPDAPAPEVFEFAGIWFDPEKQKAEREKMEVERKKLERQRRSPSPRESWFELNHPMGAYYDRRYAVDR